MLNYDKRKKCIGDDKKNIHLVMVCAIVCAEYSLILSIYCLKVNVYMLCFCMHYKRTAIIFVYIN